MKTCIDGLTWEEALASVADLERELAEVRAEAATLRQQIDAKIEDFLNGKMCCNGVECGCQGVTRLDHFVHEAAGTEITRLRLQLAAQAKTATSLP